MRTKEFMVYEGTYPFNNIIGMVAVTATDDPEADAAVALDLAITVYGDHPVVGEA